MALADTAKLLASLDLDTKPFEAGTRRASAALGGMESRFSRIGSEARRGLGTAAANLTKIGLLVGVPALTIGFKKSIEAASDLAESMSKVNVVFGENAQEVIAWSQTSATAIGASQQAALEAAGTYGNLFQAFGIGREKATDMSTTLVQLAADLASFNNTSVEDALLALRSGLSGETEPLKRFGIALSVDRMKAELMNQGIKDLGGTLTPAQKALAAYSIIMKDSALAQGDFSRTSAGLANQQRILQANFENMAATIGTALLPKVNELVMEFNRWFLGNQGAIKQFADQLPGMFSDIVGIVRAVPWAQIGDSLKLAGAGAKILLGAFNAMPDWVKTAVITGWGLNKLTGGALKNIVVDLVTGKGGLFSRGGTPATPMFTKEVGLPGGGGGPGGIVPAGKGGIGTLGKLFLIGEAIGLIAAVNEVRDSVTSAALQQATDIHKALDTSLEQHQTLEELNTKLAGIDSGIAQIKGLGNIPEAIFHDTLVELETMRKEVVAALTEERTGSREERTAKFDRQELRHLEEIAKNTKGPTRRERKDEAARAVEHLTDRTERFGNDELANLERIAKSATISWKPSQSIQVEDRRARDTFAEIIKAQTARDKTAREDMPADEIVKGFGLEMNNLRKLVKPETDLLKSIGASISKVVKNTADNPVNISKAEQKHFDRLRDRIESTNIRTNTRIDQARASTDRVRDRVESARIAVQTGTARVATQTNTAADRIIAALNRLDLSASVVVNVSGSGSSAYQSSGQYKGSTKLKNLPID